MTLGSGEIAFEHLLRELAPQVLDREVRGRDVLRLQHGLQPPLGERAGEQLPLLMQSIWFMTASFG